MVAVPEKIVLPVVLRVGVLLDHFGQLRDLAAIAAQVALAVGAVGGLHHQFAHALEGAGSMLDIASLAVFTQEVAVLRVLRVGAQAVELALQLR